jgi:sec-independent protein translocase protein TatA
VIGLENPLHLAILFAVLLLIFGGKRLPDMGRSLGAGLRNFKESISGREPAAELSIASAEEPEAAKTS